MDPNCLVTLLLYPKLFYGVDVDVENGRRESRALFVLVSVFLGCFLHRVPGITERIPAQPQPP